MHRRHNLLWKMSVAGFCKPTGLAFRPVIASCLTHTCHNCGSNTFIRVQTVITRCTLRYLYVFQVCWVCFGYVGFLPSVLWRFWGAGVVVCLEQGANLHMAQLMPLPLTVSCFRKIQIGFTFLVPAHPGSPGKRAVKRVCVCVCILGQLADGRYYYWKLEIITTHHSS